MHGFKKCLLDIVLLLTMERENKAETVWKVSSFLLTLVVNTHTPHIHYTHSEESSIPALFKYKDFQIVMKDLLKKIPPFWNSLPLSWLPSSSFPLSHCAMKMVFWAPNAASLYKTCHSPGSPYGSSRTEAKGQRHQPSPKQRTGQK